ncbi:40S ribosomal protein S27-like isoform X1 [Rhinatrema bivittatum]|uniref:40S ribosomal protein S27-like isoform X1 n=2 Tax=Rhinatrema bivittatum TaxID=194408 RepID=UPI00112AC0C3|nr:40S ribosomal protein S27-like isoform X1 [Rhinatrema bivittatum]
MTPFVHGRTLAWSGVCMQLPNLVAEGKQIEARPRVPEVEGDTSDSAPESPDGGPVGGNVSVDERTLFSLLCLAQDFLHPLLDRERQRHKKKRLVQSPNSYFMDVKCPGCYKITTVFSHAQSVVLCVGCSTILCQPTGGKCRLTEGCSFRRKPH